MLSMSMGGGRDPLDLIVNGDLATPEQIDCLERLAYKQLDKMPALLQREFGYKTDNGAIAMFRTHLDQSDAIGDMAASITIGDFYGDESDEFVMSFGIDNTLGMFGFPDMYEDDEDRVNEAFLGLYMRTDDLLTSGLLDGKSVAVITYLHGLIGRAINGEVDDIEGDEVPVVPDLIREIVDESVTCTVSIKEFGVATDPASSIELMSHMIVGNVIDVEVVGDLPILQIRHENRDDFTGYYYCHSLDGTVTLYEFDTRYEESDEQREADIDDLDVEIRILSGEPESDEELEDMEDHDYEDIFKPTARAVKLLTQRLAEAVAYDSEH